MSPLFRDEVVGRALRRLEGSVLIATPLSARILSAILLAILALAALFVTTFSYSRKETVRGWITPSGGLIRLISREGGRINEIRAREGALLAKDAVAAVVQLTPEVQSGNAGQNIMSEMETEATADEANTQAHLDKLDGFERSLKAQHLTLLNEQQEDQLRLQLLMERQRLAERAVERSDALFKRGVISDAGLENARASALFAAQATSEMRSVINGVSRQLAEVEQQLAEIPAERARVRADLTRSKAVLQQKRTNVEAQSGYRVTAPIAGTVVALPVELGQTVPPQSTIAVVAPQGAVLIAELYVPSRAIGFVKVGQEVRLMYEAFPFQKYGMGYGTITSVSQSALAPNELAIPGMRVDEPVFRVRAQLAAPYVKAYRKIEALRPGMMLEADIITDRRTLFEWLLDPLYAGGRRA